MGEFSLQTDDMGWGCTDLKLFHYLVCYYNAATAGLR